MPGNRQKKCEVRVSEFFNGTTTTYFVDPSFFGVLIGIGIFPGYLMFTAVENWSVSAGNDGLIHSLWFCIGLGMGYIGGGLGVVLVTGVFGAIFALRGREGRFH